MDSYIEKYEAKEGGVTLHTWTDVQGVKKENFYIIGMPSTPIPSWFLLEQTDHRTDQAQLTMSATARRHSLQQGTRLLVPLQQQPCCLRLTTTNSAMANKANSRDQEAIALMRAWAKPSHHVASRKPASQPGRRGYSSTALGAG